MTYEKVVDKTFRIYRQRSAANNYRMVNFSINRYFKELMAGITNYPVYHMAYLSL